MSFLKHISENTIQQSHDVELCEAETDAENALRKANFKIKIVTPTSFGTQIEFAKKYDDDDIEDVLSDFDIKFKGNSVFIIN